MSVTLDPVPYADIDTIFLDVGGTLISVDFDRICAELAARRLACEPDALRRAEAAAHPSISELFFVKGPRPDRSGFHSFLSAVFAEVPSLASLPAPELDALVTELEAVLRPDGRASALWRMVMPGVPEALERLRQLGLKMVVVSNSDGTCAESLEAAGLLKYMSCVIDSHVVGVEKPDRRIFEVALAQSGADPRRTLHIGDIYHADVLGARGAGLHAVLLDPYGDWPEMSCETAKDLGEVAERTNTALRPR